MNDMVKNIILWVVIAVVLMSVFNNFTPRPRTDSSLSYSQFIESVKLGQVVQVGIDEKTIKGEMQNGQRFVTYAPNDPHLVDDLLENGVEIKAKPPEEQSMLTQVFISWFPMLLLIGVWIFFMRQMQGGGAGGRGAMTFGKSKARMLEEDQIKVTFDDVAGVEEAKEEVEEMVDFLKDRAKYKKLGGKINRVLENLVFFAKNDIWLEITTLIVPTKNDTKEELTRLASFIKEE